MVNFGVSHAKLILCLGVALVPLIVAVGCGGAETQNPPLYTPIPLETCSVNPNAEYEVNFTFGHTSRVSPFCIPIPNSDDYMLVEKGHPIVQLAGLCDSTDVRCCTVQSFYLDLLATDPTLTANEAMRFFSGAEEMLLQGLDEQQEKQFFFSTIPCAT